MKTLLRLLRLFGLGWIIWRLFGPDLPPGYRGVQERPIHVPGRTAFVGQREFFVREAGPENGPPLVLVHGWAFDSEMTFFGVIPALSERFRLIMPDQRSHGKSDRIRGRFEIEDLADELAGLLDVLDVGPATVFGYSMGGMAAQVLASRYPGKVDRLVLAATAARPVDRRRSLARIAFLIGRALARFSKKEAAMLSYGVLLRSGVVERRYARWLWEALLTRDATLYYEGAAAIWRFDGRDLAPKIKPPVMVIVPTADQLIPARTQYELAALLTDPTVVEIAGSGHESIIARPDEYVAVIEQFVEGRDAHER